MSVLLWASSLALLGCGGEEGEGALRVQGEDRVGGDVIATVDGVAIVASEVRRVTGELGATPLETLRLLEDEELLAAAAERRGFDERADVRRVERRAAVQRVLVELEQTQSEEVTEEELESEFRRANPEGDAAELDGAARAALRKRIVRRRRFTGLASLLNGLEAELGVSRDDEAIQALFAAELAEVEGP